MITLIQYLNEKNYFLEKFCQLNEVQFKLIQHGHVDGLDHFYNQRESIISIIKNIDSKINQTITMNPTDKLTGPERESVKKAMLAKDEYVKLILDQDLEIIACIDQLKAEIFKELKTVSAGKKLVASYKSAS